MKYIILIFAFLLSFNAAAQNAGALAGSSSGAASQSGAQSGAAAGAAINQHFAAPAAATSSYGLTESKLLNTPNVINSNIYPTAPCAHSTSGGVGVPGFGISVGSSHIDDDCTRRETARVFHGMGLQADAVAVLCSTPVAQVAPSCQQRAAAVKKADAVRDGDDRRRVQSPDGRYWSQSASGTWQETK